MDSFLLEGESETQGNDQNREQQEAKANPGRLPADGGNLLGYGPKPELELDKEVEVQPLVSIKVSPGGSVTTANIVCSSSQSKVDRVAIDWARSCRFTDSPNGRAGKIRVNVKLE